MSRATVIIPTYNAGVYLVDAVACSLRQSHPQTSVIVMDDGSTDESVKAIAALRHPRIRICRQENAGKSVAINRALLKTKGDYYCILDADDVMHPERVEKQVAALEANPDVAAVFCGHELLMGGRRVAPRLRAKGRDECRRDIDAMRMPAHDPTGMYRLEMVRGYEYEPALRIGQGYDYILRIGERWPMMVMAECLYSYRVRAGSSTRSNVEGRRAAVEAVHQRAVVRRQSDVTLPPGKRRVINRDRDNGLPAHFMESVTDLKRLGRRSESLRTAIACGRLHPFDADYWKPLAISVFPEWLLRRFGRATV